MDIIVNDRKHTIDQHSTLNALLSNLNISSNKGVALAVNEQVIPRSNWDSHQLKENDEIMIIKAAQGG